MDRNTSRTHTSAWNPPILDGFVDCVLELVEGIGFEDLVGHFWSV